MIERPNKRALVGALDIYRDSMRPFIVRHLRRVPGGKVKDLVKSALQDDPYDYFEKNLSDGRSLEEAIDVDDFPRIVRAYWNDEFRHAFKKDSGALQALFSISKARNTASHPDSRDIESEYVVDRLEKIASVLANINEPAASLAVENIKKDLTPYVTPAHRFRQGGRDVYAFSLDLETLNNLLPDRVDDKVVKDANRPLTASHAKKIQKYLEDRDDWLLGALLLGISPDAVEYQSFMSSPDAESDVGQLTIRTEGAASMKMFDGQHRRRAIKDALTELSHSDRRSLRLLSLREASLPVMLYAEDSIEALRQMFADAAQTRSIERNTVTRFDQRMPSIWPRFGFRRTVTCLPDASS